MLELAALAVAGLLIGAGLSARRRAPVVLARVLYAMGGAAVILAGLTLRPPG
jgi:hypothetical protein